MASNVIAFPADRVKRSCFLDGIERPVWDADAIAQSKARYEQRLSEGYSPESLRMSVWRHCNSVSEAEWAEYEAACHAANGDNIIQLRRA